MLANISTSQSEKLQTLITAAKVEGVEPIWTSIFAKVSHALDTHAVAEQASRGVDAEAWNR